MKPAVQIIRMPTEVGQDSTLRIANEFGPGVHLELRITTPGGSVIAVPVAGGAEIRLTAGVDVAACKIDLEVTEKAQVPPAAELH